MYIWWGFVIEADGTLSNIRVCPQLEFCKGSADLENETKLFEKKLITKLKKRKVVPGFLKNEMVAIAYSGMIRFQCFDR